MAAAVLHSGAGLEAAHADRAECELEDELRAALEHARAPELRANRESPFGRVEPRVEVADLEDPDGRVVALERDREARVLAGFTFAMGPRDEPLEAFDRRRRRRDEARDFFRRQQREERRGVGLAEVAENHRTGGEYRKTGAPVRGNDALTNRGPHRRLHVD